MFPNAAGTQWTYTVTDGLSSRNATLVVSIEDVVFIPELVTYAGQWTYTPDENWMGITRSTTFVTAPSGWPTAEDTVNVYIWPDGFSPMLIDTYRLPMAAGGGWSHPEPYMLIDSSEVLMSLPQSWPPSPVDSVYVVRRRYSCGDECSGLLVYHFKPGVGIVFSHRREMDIMEFPQQVQLDVYWYLTGFVRPQ
jgi:hypothetical protein